MDRATTRQSAALSVRAQLMAELEREEITARIKQARKEAGLTQEEIADLLDVRSRTYQNYEATRIPWSLIGTIADVTGKTSRWLLHGEEEPAAALSPDLLAQFAKTPNNERFDRLERMLVEVLERLDEHGLTLPTPGEAAEAAAQRRDAQTATDDQARDARRKKGR